MIKKFMIENESEADDFLSDLLTNEKYRSMDEVKMRSQELIKDINLQNYFINKAREILQK